MLDIPVEHRETSNYEDSGELDEYLQTLQEEEDQFLLDNIDADLGGDAEEDIDEPEPELPNKKPKKGHKDDKFKDT